VKRIIWSSVFVVFGIMVVAGGIMKLNRGDAECGSQTMYAGQTCVSTSVSGEEVGSSSLEDQRASTKFGNVATTALGALIVVFAARSLKIGIQGRKKKEPEPLPGSLNQQWDRPQQNWQQQAPPPQYQPQQYQPQQYQPQQHQPQQYPAQQYQPQPYQQQAPPQQQYPPQQPGWEQPQPGWGPQSSPQGQQQGWGPQG
jgi:hypothetical protein